MPKETKKVPKVVLFLENSRQYGRDLIRGIAKYSRLYGPWSFYREDMFYNRTKKTSYDLSWIKKWGADGIITRDFMNIDKLMELDIPIISARAFQKKIKNVAEIFTDDLAIGEIAYEHFSRRGFKNFAYCGFRDMQWSRSRATGFAQTLKDNGFEVHSFDSLSSRMLNWENEHPRIIEWLESLPKPVAILCCNDDRGCDLIEACKTGGLRVPFEIAVLGVDNDNQVCDLSNPPLSSIRLSTENAGFKAAEVLDNLMSNITPQTTKIRVKPLEVVCKQSTDTLAINDSHVVKAMQFINQNFNRLIQVGDVLTAAGCSRRSLDEKFQRHLGYTVFAEIRRVRIENIAQMLLETDLNISTIAFNLGYNDSDHIARFFKQEKGLTPQAYRNKYATGQITPHEE